MATMLAWIRVKPGQAARYEAAQRDLAAATMAEGPTVLRYEFWRGTEPDCFWGLLAFSDNTAFYRHQASPAHDAFAAVFADCVDTYRLEWLDPLDQPGSTLPPTEPRPLPAESSASVRAMAAQFPVVRADWWASVPPVKD